MLLNVQYTPDKEMTIYRSSGKANKTGSNKSEQIEQYKYCCTKEGSDSVFHNYRLPFNICYNFTKNEPILLKVAPKCSSGNWLASDLLVTHR